MFEGPNITRSHGLPPPLNSSSVLATKASAGITSVSSLTPSLSYKSCSIRVSEYFTNSAFTTARIVCPSYGRAVGPRQPADRDEATQQHGDRGRGPEPSHGDLPCLRFFSPSSRRAPGP